MIQITAAVGQQFDVLCESGVRNLDFHLVFSSSSSFIWAVTPLKISDVRPNVDFRATG